MLIPLGILAFASFVCASAAYSTTASKGFLALSSEEKLWKEFSESERRLQRGQDNDNDNDGDAQDDDQDEESNGQEDEKPADPMADKSPGETATYFAKTVKKEVVNNANMLGLSRTAACSCDCCQVQKLTPATMITKPDGRMITSVCMKPRDDQAENPICPDTCQQRSEVNDVLEAAKGEVDYSRFCSFECRASTDALGSACESFSAGLNVEAMTPDGNGKELHPPPIFGINSGLRSPEETGLGGSPIGILGGRLARPVVSVDNATAAASSTSAEQGQAGAANATQNEAKKAKITYDMRKLIAERLRAEAGANVATAAASAEKVRMNLWSTKKATDAWKKQRRRSQVAQANIEAGAAAVEARKQNALKAELDSNKNFAEGRMFASTMAKKVRDLTEETIEKEVTPCIEQYAADKASRKGLDKPPDWSKVVAARVADPYMKAVTTAVQRTAEYKNLADGLANKAYGVQKQANDLISHVNVLEAQGDALGAAIDRKHASDMLANAKALWAQATGDFDTAQKTRDTIPKWQMAAQQAAAYATWEYGNDARVFR